MIDLEKSINQILNAEGKSVTAAVSEIVPEVAKQAAKRLRQTSPSRTGRYAKGWTSTVEKSRLSTTATVHGKSGTYQLAHLLEHGHAKRGGGRTAAIVHIAPVEEWANEEVEKELERKLSE